MQVTSLTFPIANGSCCHGCSLLMMVNQNILHMIGVKERLIIAINCHHLSRKERSGVCSITTIDHGIDTAFASLSILVCWGKVCFNTFLFCMYKNINHGPAVVPMESLQITDMLFVITWQVVGVDTITMYKWLHIVGLFLSMVGTVANLLTRDMRLVVYILLVSSISPIETTLLVGWSLSIMALSKSITSSLAF